MTIIRAAAAPRFELPGLTVRALASPRRGASETAVWWLALAPGTPGTAHAVTREEIFVAISGRATVTLGDATSELRAGDALVVPPGRPFALANPSAEPFEAIVSFPVGGQAVVGGDTFTPPWAE